MKRLSDFGCRRYSTNDLSCSLLEFVKAEEMVNFILKNEKNQPSEPKQDDETVRLRLSGIFHELEDKDMVLNVMERVEAFLRIS